jgi:hypothetical protein
LQHADLEHLAEDDPRRLRARLAPHVFAVPGTGEYPPIDLIDAEACDSLIALPTHVLLRSTEFQGRCFSTSQRVWAAWIHASPASQTVAPFVFDAAIDAGDEFKAGPFLSSHGDYRQATACLRNALELLVHASALAIAADRESLARWRRDDLELRFRRTADALAAKRIRELDPEVGSAGPVFGQSGWVRALYRWLCGSVHSRAGRTNTDIWRSNGPIWIPNAREQFIDDLRELPRSVALCCALPRTRPLMD